MLKTIPTLIALIAALSFSTAALAESITTSQNFQIIVRIPEHVVMSPEVALSKATTQTTSSLPQAKQELVIRNNHEVVLKTQVTL